MASESQTERLKFYESVKHFPPVINGRISVVEFLEATTDLVTVVDRISKYLAPVKYDMQGNIDKIKKLYEFDENSCLLDLMITEETKGKPGIEAVVWLNRAMLFFELTFQELIASIQMKQLDIPTKKIFTLAYEGSVKKYHNWVTQQIFAFVCKMSPTIHQILKAVEADDDLKAFEKMLTLYIVELHIVRCKIDDFVNENNLFE